MTHSFKSGGIGLLPPPPDTLSPELLGVIQWVSRAFEGLVPRLNEPSETRYTVLHAAPGRPREGQLVYADGTDWDPGDGAGLYLYTGSAWVRLLSSDEYEADVFTPTLAFGTPGTSTWAYATQTGFFIRRRDLVWINLELTATPTIGTGTGNVLVGGLPYSAHATVQGLILSNMSANWAWGAGFTDVYARTNSGTLVLARQGTAVSAAAFTQAQMTDGAAHSLRITGEYRRV